MSNLRIKPANEQLIELGGRCILFRKRNLLTRKEMAGLMGVTLATLSGFERKGIVGLKTLREFLRVEGTYRLRKGKIVSLEEMDNN